MSNYISINGQDNSLDIGVNFDPSYAVVSSRNNFPLSFQTNSIERLRIADIGIGTDNTATNILGVVNGTNTLTYINNVSSASGVETVSNKTIKSTQNNILITSAPMPETNINAIINQPLTTGNNVQFANVNATTLVRAPTGNFNAINSLASDNTALINGVNPLYTANTLAANVNQNVTSSGNPMFNTLSLTGGLNMWNGLMVEYQGTTSRTAGFGAYQALNLIETPQTTIMIEFRLLGIATAGPNIYTGMVQYASSYISTDNLGAGLSNGNTFIVNNVNGLTGGYNFVVADPNIGMYITDDINNDMNWTWYIKVYYMN